MINEVSLKEEEKKILRDAEDDLQRERSMK
jgi:hypothetical protein